MHRNAKPLEGKMYLESANSNDQVGLFFNILLFSLKKINKLLEILFFLIMHNHGLKCPF